MDERKEDLQTIVRNREEIEDKIRKIQDEKDCFEHETIKSFMKMDDSYFFTINWTRVKREAFR